MLGFLFGVAVIVAGGVFDLPSVSSALVLLIFAGWIFFPIRRPAKKFRLERKLEQLVLARTHPRR